MFTNCITTRENLSSEQELKTSLEKMIYLASLAGSTHNTQPWKVDILSDTSLILRADFSRKLNVVDPTCRELYISLGAFIENFCLAAESYGYEAVVKLSELSLCDDRVAKILLKPNKISQPACTKIENRTTLRVPFKNIDIKTEDWNILTNKETAHYHYFPNQSKTGRYIADATIAAYTQQAHRTDVQEELAYWIRFSNRHVKSKRDGLTTSGMGIKGVGGFIVSRFLKPADSKRKSFVETGVTKTIEQANNCGGWLIVTQPENTPSDWINAGRLYQRFHLACKDLSIGFHPMNQAIEEENFARELTGKLNLKEYILVIARIGYVDNYPKAVSVRRNLNDFVTDYRKQ